VRMFVAGGTGVLGRPLVEALVDRGHEVTASTHRTENFSVIEALGARPALMDGLDDAAVRQAILEPAPQAEWLPYLAELLDAPPPRHVSEEEAEEQIGTQAVYYGTQLRAAGNAKAKSELGLTLEYPSWRGGIPVAARMSASAGPPGGSPGPGGRGR
jgi:uncharacterized protein YbjT (DUF2867 family)